MVMMITMVGFNPSATTIKKEAGNPALARAPSGSMKGAEHRLVQSHRHGVRAHLEEEERGGFLPVGAGKLQRRASELRVDGIRASPGQYQLP